MIDYLELISVVRMYAVRVFALSFHGKVKELLGKCKLCFYFFNGDAMVDQSKKSSAFCSVDKLFSNFIFAVFIVYMT